MLAESHNLAPESERRPSATPDAADAFKNSLAMASDSALRDLAEAARIFLKRTTGRDFTVTLKPAGDA